MKEIAYHNDRLMIEEVAVEQIAQHYATPFYVYSQKAILANLQDWQTAVQGVPHLICFALKANDNLAILRLLSQAGAGADVVSAGELFLAQHASVAPTKIVYAGVGKQSFEIEAALQAGIRAFNVESESELWMIQATAAQLNTIAPVHLRVNPDIDAKSHPYITTGMAKNKFGIETSRAIELIRFARTLPNIDFKGIQVHIGSQILDLSPFEDCSRALRELYLNLTAQNIPVHTIDLGGGLGVDYRQVIDWPAVTDPETKPTPTVSEYIRAILKHLKDLPVEFVFEPGRSLIANPALLIVTVTCTKVTSQKKFIIVNGGMNDLIRPSLYQAYHRILPVVQPVRKVDETVDVVGPICETTDFFARDRRLPLFSEGELLAIFSAGAYGYSLASNYNGRCRRAEVLVDGADFRCIRRAETYEDFLRLYEEL